jgi:hypothetical protein
MHSYVDLFFSPDGASPLEISDRLKKVAGLSFIIGAHDLAFEWTNVDEFRDQLQKVHEALRGSGILYRIETVADEPGFVEPVPWPPPIHRGPAPHPGY